MQNNTFEYFMHLIYLRNEANRKRRRFLCNSYTFGKNRWGGDRSKTVAVTHMSYADCMNGYHKAKEDIKSFKKQILSLKKSLGVKAYQNKSGGYVEVIRGDERFTSEDFKTFHLMVLAEQHLLGGKYETT